jgi:hypothetical protein
MKKRKVLNVGELKLIRETEIHVCVCVCVGGGAVMCQGFNSTIKHIHKNKSKIINAFEKP